MPQTRFEVSVSPNSTQHQFTLSSIESSVCHGIGTAGFCCRLIIRSRCWGSRAMKSYASWPVGSQRRKPNAECTSAIISYYVTPQIVSLNNEPQISCGKST